MNTGFSFTRRLAMTIALVVPTLVVPIGSFWTRSVVELPAWQHLGPVAWAAFSRQADVGNGEIYYPLFGIVRAVRAVAMAVSYWLTRAASRSRAAIPVLSACLTAVFAIGVLPATTQAAPQMLSPRHLGNDAAALQHALDVFSQWRAIRAAGITLGYFSSLWAVLALATVRDATDEGKVATVGSEKNRAPNGG